MCITALDRFVTINTKSNSHSSFNFRLISKNNNKCPWSQRRDFPNQFHTICLNKNKMTIQLECQSYSTDNLSILFILNLIFAEFEYFFVIDSTLWLLSHLNNIIFTDFNTPAVSCGKSPILVSPEVMLASVKSNTELVTSEISALVGLGFVYIDSSICVAVITNFPELIVLWVINFCKRTNF